ncbi:hypothetical protein [Bradyrhizobium cenepequi]|uniref:hypothetical protein n=1 Tax=Bradyrhizobium cenepequi TaxID=2821403 RepID=UPI001CE28C97|nr:hypothetical protein [Bradyrhizobium cenepequi]MCA6106111.1 hypothetical protein [Bradyrhizobium cenepequi]
MDWNNDYSCAGKGAKRRRISLETIPRNIGTRKNKPKPYLCRPKAAQHETTKREERNVTERGLKSKIRRLTLQTDTFGEVCDELRRANYPGSAVLVSTVRNEMREIVKLLIEEGLIDKQRLEGYRREYQRERKR